MALPPGVKEVQRIAAPGGGFYVLGSDGGVFAIEDAQGKTPQFYGSYMGLAPEQRQGSRTFQDISLDPTGGYTIRADDGSAYRFDTNQARSMGLQVPDAVSTIMADPAMQAFLRTSGLGIDQAAANVARQTTDINANRDVRIGEQDRDYDDMARRTRGSHEARGILRSSTRQHAEDKVEDFRGRAKEQTRKTAADQIAGLNRGLTDKIIGVQGTAGEKALNIADTQAIDMWGNEMRKKYPDAFATGLVK